MYYNIKLTKDKARLSRLLRHPAWKRRGPILISALHKFVTYSCTYLYRHLYPFAYSPGPINGGVFSKYLILYHVA